MVAVHNQRPVQRALAAKVNVLFMIVSMPLFVNARSTAAAVLEQSIWHWRDRQGIAGLAAVARAAAHHLEAEEVRGRREVECVALAVNTVFEALLSRKALKPLKATLVKAPFPFPFTSALVTARNAIVPLFIAMPPGPFGTIVGTAFVNWKTPPLFVNTLPEPGARWSAHSLPEASRGNPGRVALGPPTAHAQIGGIDRSAIGDRQEVPDRRSATATMIAPRS